MLFWRKAFEKMFKMSNITLIYFTLSFFFISPIIIHILEPEKFSTYIKGLWWVIVTTTTVGYGDYFPETIPGMIFGTIVIFTGLFLIGTLIAKISERFIKWIKMKEEGKMDYRGEDHYVIIGWSDDKIKDTIKEMLNSDSVHNIVLIADLPSSPIDHSQIHYIQGEPTEYETLDRANVAKSKAVIIFSPQGVPAKYADGQTLLIATTIESYGEKVNRHIYTIAEILKENHLMNFKHAKVDELILSQQSISYLIAHASVHKGSSKLFMNLLSTESGEKIYVINKKKEWITYNDAFEEIKAMGALLIADHDDTSIIRRPNTIIPEQAKLFIIADENTFQKISEGYVINS